MLESPSPRRASIVYPALVRSVRDGTWHIQPHESASLPGSKLSPGRVDALVLTSAYSDHLHRPTLSLLPRTTPVFAHRTAARIMRTLGFTEVTTLTDGDEVSLPGGVTLHTIAPAFPFTFTANGYVYSDGTTRLYHETHLVDLERAAERASGVDLLLAPVQSVRVAGVPFAMSPERALRTATRLAPKTWVPTGIDPQRGHGLLQRTLISCRGSVDEFAERLKGATQATVFAQPAPGEAVLVGATAGAASAVGP